MKSQKSSNSIKALAVSVIVCMALILSTVFSFCLYKTKGAAAEDGAREENGVRFVQVAAGEDFAIGLTYDGDLYGWSLLDGEHADGETLGSRYTSTPTKINVVLRAGPGSNGTRSWNNSNYHDTYENQNSGRKDRILQIAATRYTAAFITEAGYLYTWGSDATHRDYDYTAESSAVHNLLLRPCTAVGSATAERWYEPYIIDYGYYGETGGNKHALTAIIPNSFGNMSIAGGEYNYIFVYSTSNGYYSFVWGGMQYAITNRAEVGSYSSPEVLGSITSGRYVFQTPYTINNVSAVTAVAGGYTVGMNNKYSGGELFANTTSLTLRGRNFISTQPLTSSAEGKLKPVPTVATNKLNYSIEGVDSVVASNGYSEMTYAQGTSYTVEDAIIGGYSVKQGTVQNPGDGRYVTSIGAGGASADGRNADLYYGRQAVAASGSGTITYSGNSDKYNSLEIYNSDGIAINDGESDAKLIHNDVSLGNDIGYGIRNGQLYAWGDNACGQLTSAVSEQFSSYPKQIMAGTSFISVAAGKQISSADKPFIFNETLNGTDFSESVRNDEKFISGAVAENGNLYVWSNNSSTPQALVFGGATVNGGNSAKSEYNYFAAVYSGYKNNLFAITRLGKLVRIVYDNDSGEYKQTVYDKFIGSENNEIVNWTAGNLDNKVNFAVRAKDWADPTTPPELGAFTLYLDNGYVNKSSISLNGVSDDNTEEKAHKYAGVRGSIVTANAIGDVYRILDYNNDSGIKYLNTTGTSADDRSLTAEQLKPVFKFNGVVMEDKQRENMFDFDIVYSAEYGIGIQISPKQSSKDGEITVEFYVARFDCAENFVIDSDSFPQADNGIYYDYKKCSLKFTIENTPAYKVFERMGDDGNSNIPLLDPNNAYNNKYSVAVQDVNTGYIELVKYLQSDSNNANFADAVLAEMKKNDAGYPDARKKELGNLDYSLGEAAAQKAYGGTYQFLLRDRDADLSLISNVTAEFTGGAQSGSVTASRAKIDISVDVTNFGLKQGETHYSRRQLFAKNFNNIYGIYDVTFTESDDGKLMLSFSYDVVTFTAINGTGSIKYNSDSVTSYSTSENDSKYANINVTTREYTTYTNDFVVNKNGKTTNGNWNSAVAVFSQPTVRLKDAYKNDNNSIYGDADGGNNSFTVDYTETHTVTVGTTYTIYLSDYIQQPGVTGSQISFSFKNAVNFADFNKQFTDETGYYAAGEIVKVNTSSITVRPTTTHPINFTIAIQRFYGNGTQYFADGDEKIYLTFKFGTIGGFDLSHASGANLSPRIEQKTEVDVLNYISLPERYRNLIRLSSIQSLDTNVLGIDTVIPEDIGYINDTKFSVSPKSSGTSVVQFVVTVYDKSIIVTLTFYVSGVTNINDPIEIVDVQYVYLNSLLNSLRKANSFNAAVANYTALTRDVDERGNSNAVFFTDANGEVQANYPPFVKSAYFVDIDSANPRLRIEANTDEIDLDGEYRLCMRFVNDMSGYTSYAQAVESKATILTTSQVIRSSRRIALEDGVIYTIYVDCDESKAVNSVNRFGDWYTDGINTDMKVYIPVQMLLGKISGVGSPEAYDIFLVSASSDAAAYFNYSYTTDKKFVVITPLYNTPLNDDGTQRPMTVSVSTASNSSSDSLILSFRIAVTGISTTLPKTTYVTIWLVAFFGSLGFLLIIFLIRMIVYWRRRAKQRAIIKRNQELIKMRDRIHNKATAATREQALKTKLKMNDPKYAKLFNEMKKDRQDDGGITLENADFSAPPQMSTGKAPKSKKKKKGGKKTIAELRAELEAKKAAFAQAQSGDVISPINPFGDPMAGGQGFVEPQGFDTPVETFDPQPMDGGNEIIFDVPDDGSQG